MDIDDDVNRIPSALSINEPRAEGQCATNTSRVLVAASASRRRTSGTRRVSALSSSRSRPAKCDARQLAPVDVRAGRRDRPDGDYDDDDDVEIEDVRPIDPSSREGEQPRAVTTPSALA